MQPAQFKYRDQRNLIELLVLISALQDAKSLAGGQSLMPIIKKLFIVLEDIVDTNEIDELNYFCQESGHLKVNAI